MTRVTSRKLGRYRNGPSQRVIEDIEIGGHNDVVAVVAVHVDPAALACREPGSRVGEQAGDRIAYLLGSSSRNTESFAIYDAIGIEHRHDRDAVGPRVQIGVGEAFQI